MASWISDWNTRLRGRIATQYRGTNVEEIAGAYAAQIQELENAGQALKLVLRIDPVTDDTASHLYWVGRAAQLDRIGIIVGRERGGASDAIYRLYLRAQIKANKSSGSPPNLFAVFQAMLDGDAEIEYVPGLNATMVLRIIAPPLDGEEAAVALSLLSDAKAAGVRAILEWWPAPAGDMFSLDDASSIGSGDGLGCSDATNIALGGCLAGAQQAE